MSLSDHGPIEIRTAQLEAVAYPKRLIELIAVPYDQWTTVDHHGKVIEESVAPGAFGHAIENRARRFLVNMEHDPDRWVGAVMQFDAQADVGLRAKVRVRRTPDGDQALDDAADGMLSASVGMAVSRDGQTWDHGRRRIHKAFLDHIALCAQPAYAGAEILDVRHASTSATPNLDRILAMRSEQSYRVT